MFGKWILIEKAEDVHGKRFFGSVISESRQWHGMETIVTVESLGLGQ